LGLNETLGLEGKLNQSIQAAENKIRTTDLHELTAKVLMMRRHEKDFILRGEQKYLARIDQRRREFDTLLEGAFLDDAAKGEITELVDDYQAAMREYGSTYLANKADFNTLDQTFRIIEPHLKELFDFAVTGLERAQQRSEEVVETAETTITVVGLAAIVVFVTLGMMILYSISRPIEALTEATMSLAAGDVTTAVPATGYDDEIGRMAKALETFKANAFDRLAMQESSAIVTSALKFTKANVMIADTDHTITFMNRAMREMFKNAEQDLRRDLPNFGVDSLIGVSMDDFHKDANHQRQLMDSLKHQHVSEIHTGGRVFTHVSNPIFDQEGQRLGTVVEWEDRTDEVAMETALASVFEAVNAGKLDQRVNLDTDNEFLQTMARSMNEVSETVGRVLDEVATAARSLADGDLSVRVSGS